MARIVWQLEPCAYPFDFVLAEHLEHGYVFSTPDLFLMARPVKHDAPYEEITNPAVQHGNSDGWWIYCAAACWRVRPMDFMEWEPYPLPFIGWERDNKLRFYRRERLLKHASSLRENAGQAHPKRDEQKGRTSEGSPNLQLNAS